MAFGICLLSLSIMFSRFVHCLEFFKYAFLFKLLYLFDIFKLTPSWSFLQGEKNLEEGRMGGGVQSTWGTLTPSVCRFLFLHSLIKAGSSSVAVCQFFHLTISSPQLQSKD